MTTVINMNLYPVQVRLTTPTGPDCAHIMGRGRVDLPSEVSVDANWLAANGTNIRLVNAAATAPAPVKAVAPVATQGKISIKG